MSSNLLMRLSPGPLKETKNDTDEIPDYGRHRRDRHFEEQMISLGESAYYWNRTVKQEEKTQFVGDDIPTNRKRLRSQERGALRSQERGAS